MHAHLKRDTHAGHSECREEERVPALSPAGREPSRYEQGTWGERAASHTAGGPPGTHCLFAFLLELTGTVPPCYPVRVLKGVWGTDSHGRQGKGQHGVFRGQGSAMAVTYRVHMGVGRVHMVGKSTLQLASSGVGSCQPCHVGAPGNPEGVEYGRNIITMGFIQ